MYTNDLDSVLGEIGLHMPYIIRTNLHNIAIYK